MNQNGDKPTKLHALEIRATETKKSWDRLLKIQYLIRPGFITWAIVAVTALILVYLISGPRVKVAEAVYLPPLREGDPVISVRDLKIPIDLEVPDHEGTLKKQAEAEEAVRNVYDYDPAVPDKLKKKIGSFFSDFRELYPPESGAGDAAPILVPSVFLPEREQELLHQFVDELTPEDLEVLKDAKFSADIEAAIAALVELPYKGKDTFIVADRQQLLKHQEPGVTARRINAGPDDPTRDIDNLDAVLDLTAARRELERLAPEKISRFSPNQQAVVLRVTRGLLEPNLTYNKNRTEDARTATVAAVKQLYYKFKKDEIICRRGDRLNAETIKKIDAIMSALETENRPSLRNAGMFVILIGFLSTIINFGKRNIRKFRLDPKDMIFLSSVLVCSLAAMKGVNFLASAAQSNFVNAPEGLNFYYLVPLGAAAMMVRMVLNSEIALVFSVTLAVLGGFAADNSLLFGAYTMIGSVVAADEVRHCRQRSTILRAGLILGLVNVLLVVLVSMVTNQIFNYDSLVPFSKSLFLNAFFALFGGIMAAIVVTGLVPLAEYLFAYATDIKLLELLNQDNELLKELSMHSPGTHQHALMVSNLSENAAKVIGANPLLARVCAMYHDIGKMNKPLYFAENQWDGNNIHEKLSPSMSTLIIHNHVKEGVELAEKHKLPRVVADAIRQHHGTSLLAYFFSKAKEQDDTGVPVDEIDFRYPGPRPQTRETAIIMLADVVESASRSVRDPNAAKLQGMVQKLINRFFIDGQLDECDLTLKNLHEIARSFNTTLGAIYHHRPEYQQPAVKGVPGRKKLENKPAEKPETKPENNKAENDADKLKNRGNAKSPDQPDKDEEDGENYLKRLGM